MLDSAAEPEPGDAEEEPSDPKTTARGERTEQSDAHPRDLPLVGLHAKLYVAETGWEASLWTGSANATRAAFNRNVEFLVELRAKRSRCGIDVLLGQPSGDAKQAACLIDLLQPYAAIGEHANVDHEQEAFDRYVDDLAWKLAAAAPVASCEALEEAGSYALTIRPIRALMPQIDGTLRARPISLKAFDAQELNIRSEEPWARFARVSLLGLTSFFAFEMTSWDGNHVRQFVLNIPLENIPVDRQHAILRHLLSDRDRVLRFLLLLLSDSDALGFAHWLAEGSDGHGQSSFLHTMFGETLFESLVRALDRDPARLDQVARIIADLRQSQEGVELVPDDFDSVWQPVWEVHRRQTTRQRGRKRQRRT